MNQRGLLAEKNKKILSVAFKCVFAAVILTGILSRIGIFSGNLTLHTLCSFTMISNSYVFFITVITMMKTRYVFADFHLILSKLRLIGVMMILITGLVYHFILLPQKLAENPDYQIFTYGNIVVHYITPACMLLDWLLFDVKGKLSKWEPLIYVIVPFLYFIIASIYGYIHSKAPYGQNAYVYFFMDFGKFGLAGVLQWTYLILICVLCLVYLIYYIDYTLAEENIRFLTPK